MGWVTPYAPLDDDLSQCIQCGLCLPSCPTYRVTGLETASPRGRLSAMSAIAAGHPIDDRFEQIMGSCLQCRACEVVCPSFVPFGKAMEGARTEVAAQRPGFLRRIRRLGTAWVLGNRRAVRLLTLGAKVAQATPLKTLAPAKIRRSMTGLRSLRGTPPTVVGRTVRAQGEKRGVAGLLAGCVMDTWFGNVHTATVDLLSTIGWEVVSPPEQTCCGALAAHDGWADDTRKMAATNVAAFRDFDLVVVDSAGCGAHMKEYGHWAEGGTELAAKVVDITEVIAEAIDDGVLPRLASSGERVAVQDPCHLRHVQRITAEPRQVLEAAGLTVMEIDSQGRCCGAAGVYSLLEPEMSRRLGSDKAEQIKGTEARLVSSPNPGCEMQLRTHLMEQGHEARVAHPVELYHEALRKARAGQPTQ